MKVGKDGRLKLSKDERQYGSFIYKNEAEYIKVCDINGNLTHRVSKQLTIGKMMEIAMNEKQTVWLENYAKLIWLFSNIVTDEQFFAEIDKVCNDCAYRHPEIYGLEPNISKEEDDEILKESEEVYRAVEELSVEE